MHKDPPTLNDENFPRITCTKTQSDANNITIIPETPIEQQQQNEETIKFLSPLIISKTTLTNSTSQPLSTSTPNKDNDKEKE